MKTLRKGNMAEVTQSKHCDVYVGDCGVVETVLEEGYAIRFSGNFALASDVNARISADRTVFFGFDEVKTPTAKVQDPKLLATLQLLQEKIKQEAADRKAKKNARSN